LTFHSAHSPVSHFQHKPFV